MKKTLLALAALTAFAGAASAQSSVTLFGIIDVDVRQVKNDAAGTVKSENSNGAATNRWGIRGTEDLGGGLKANFWLEAQTSPDIGTADGSKFWGRRSTVSLSGKFGEVRLGRDYVPTFLNVVAFDTWGYAGVGSISNIRNNFLTTGSNAAATPTNVVATTAVRADNMVSYILPAMGGLYGQASVAAGEGTTGNKYVGARLGYAAGPLNIGGAWGKTYRTGTMVDELTSLNFSASYNLGFATLQGTYEKSDYSVRSQKLMSGTILVPVGAGTIKASYHQAKGSGAANNDDLGAKVLAIGYWHDLSKRTTVYANYAEIDNSGNATRGARYVVPGGSTNGFLSGKTSSGLSLGIRHMF